MNITFKDFLIQLKEDYKTAKTKFLADKATESDITTAIDTFKKIQNRLTGDEKNIDWWAKQGWTKFEAFIKTKAAEKTKSSLKKTVGDALFLRDDDQWTILVPLDHEASCFYGKGTDWCTTKQNRDYFANYFFEEEVTLIYCISKTDSNIHAAIALDKEDLKRIVDAPHNLSSVHLIKLSYFNKEDDHMSESQFMAYTGLNPRTDVLKLLIGHHELIAQKRIENAKSDLNIIISKMTRNQAPNKEIENLIIAKEASEAALKYIKIIFYSRYIQEEFISYPPLEPTILKSLKDIVKYFRYYRSGKAWPEAEPQILTDCFATKNYMMRCLINVYKDPWKPGIEAILKGNINTRYRTDIGYDNDPHIIECIFNIFSVYKTNIPEFDEYILKENPGVNYILLRYAEVNSKTLPSNFDERFLSNPINENSLQYFSLSNNRKKRSKFEKALKSDLLKKYKTTNKTPSLTWYIYKYVKEHATKEFATYFNDTYEVKINLTSQKYTILKKKEKKQ